MPKDGWASTRRRDAVRRAKAGAGKPYFSRKKAKGKGSKAKKQDVIRQQMQASKRHHDKALGPSKPAKAKPAGYLLAAGRQVQICRDDGGEWPIWQPYAMRKTITAAPHGEADGYRVFRFEGWLIRIPSGF